jgi:hypothetical protein
MPVAATNIVPQIKAHALASPDCGSDKAFFPAKVAIAMQAVTENSRFKLN